MLQGTNKLTLEILILSRTKTKKSHKIRIAHTTGFLGEEDIHSHKGYTEVRKIFIFIMHLIGRSIKII